MTLPNRLTEAQTTRLRHLAAGRGLTPAELLETTLKHTLHTPLLKTSRRTVKSKLRTKGATR